MPDVLRDQDEHHGDEQAQVAHVEGRRVEVRQAQDRGVDDLGELNLTAHHGGDVADEHADENRQAPDDALEHDGDEQDRDDRDDRRHRSLLDVVPGRGRQVEADERDDRSGDDRGHEAIDPAGPGQMDDDAHEQ